MKALEELKEEHKLISRAVTVLESEAARIDEGAAPRPELIDGLVDFFQGFADLRHHRKEEHFLFPLLAGKKDIIRNGPVKVLTAEHESGRYFARELQAGAEGLRQGDPKAVARVRRALGLYAQMLRKHMAKEEEIVFLLAEVLLSEDESRQLAEDFRRAEETEQGNQCAASYESLVEKMAASRLS